nr:hypothetical protein [Castellaniella defragrans]
MSARRSVQMRHAQIGTIPRPAHGDRIHPLLLIQMRQTFLIEPVDAAGQHRGRGFPPDRRRRMAQECLQIVPGNADHHPGIIVQNWPQPSVNEASAKSSAIRTARVRSA